MDPPKAKKAKYNNEEFDDFVERISDDDDDAFTQTSDVKLIDNYPLVEGKYKNYKSLVLKSDHDEYPIWISPSGKLYLEAFNKLSKLALEFLTTIAEPVSRPAFAHIYQLTTDSLYAAVSGGVEASEIKKYLERFSKTEIPMSILNFINEATLLYGKANLVLQNGEFKIESKLINHLKTLIKDPEILDCLVLGEDNQPVISSESIDKEETTMNNKEIAETEVMDKDVTEFMHQVDEFADQTANVYQTSFKAKEVVHSLRIQDGKLEKIQQRCKKVNATLLVEYDYKNDISAKTISLDLRSTTTLRPYQEKSLRKMFSNNRARSGIIVLPCGAGKTLVGVTAACTMKKSCIVFCTGGVAVEQWKQHFINYTTIESNKITRFTGTHKETVSSCDIFITTYAMIGNTKSKNMDTRSLLDWVKKQSWGLIILDEVHTIPADTFRNTLNYVYGHCKLGLTATLVREDNKIEDLSFIVGPKLYEADWLDLQDKGFIARVQCMEVRCEMTPKFYWRYLSSAPSRQMLFYVMNPEKVRRCEFLIKYHERRGDKIIVFSDNLFALRNYAVMMGKPYLEGSTSHEERLKIMDIFRKSSHVNTLFVSKLADVALDLPEASVLIQISSQGKSRRQEAQRLGRITRAKKGMRPNEVNAYFYSLISSDTVEQKYAYKRQKYLKDQGYSFKVVTKLDGMDQEDLLLSTEQSQDILLSKVIEAGEEANEVESTKVKPPTNSKSGVKSISTKNSEIMAAIQKKKKERDLTGGGGGGKGPVFVDTTAPSSSYRH